jgi:ribosome-associated heat shock protein Hsp15
VRLDKALWYLRFTKTRNLAQDMVLAGHIRLNGRRIARPATKVAVGDLLVLPLAEGVRIIRLIALPGRRGPASEAQSCYLMLDEQSPLPIAAAPEISDT